MVLTEPPPPEPSMMRMMGRRSSFAMRSARIGFIGDGRVGRAAAHREIVAEDHDRTAIDLGAPHDAVGGGELL